MDLSGTERLHGMSAAKVLARFAARVEKEIGITVSIGLSANKFLAKIASDLDKPRGFAVLGQAEAASFLADKPVSFIYGVGKVAAQRFAKDGYRLIADLQRADERELMRRYGAEGQRLCAACPRHRCARRSIRSASARACRRKPPSRRDIASFRPLEKRLWAAAEEVSDRLKEKQLCGLDRHAQAQDRGLPHPHPRALAGEPDATRRQNLRRRPRSAGARDQRHALSPDRHRRQRAGRRRGRRSRRPDRSLAASGAPRPNARSTACAASSATRPMVKGLGAGREGRRAPSSARCNSRTGLCVLASPARSSRR